ncbi:hypothetical protein MASR2M74_00660 [Paracoccaceae bacterium]
MGFVLLAGEAFTFWWMWALAALPAFAAGLAEDLTKKVGVKMRLAATLISGLLFCMISGFSITQVDIPGADQFLSVPIFSVLFTAFAIGGIANATNIIDGVNGLASGTGMIILAAFALVAWLEGDLAMVSVCLLGLGSLLGFFLLNFPHGRLFLGDAGAYVTGLLLAAVAVALPARNPALSPLIGLLALAYPVVETTISMHRRIVSDGSSPGQADRLHLHSLIFRSRARQLAQAMGRPRLRSALTSVVLWSLSLLSCTLMVAGRDNSGLILLGMALVATVYVTIYRRVALLRPREPRERQVA